MVLTRSGRGTQEGTENQAYDEVAPPPTGGKPRASRRKSVAPSAHPKEDVGEEIEAPAQPQESTAKEQEAAFASPAANTPKATPEADPTVLEPHPSSAERPQSTERPRSTERPGKTEGPHSTEGPRSTERPRSTDRSRSTEPPRSTERPRSTEQPHSSKLPRSTEGPAKEPLPDDLPCPPSSEQPMLSQMRFPSHTHSRGSSPMWWLASLIPILLAVFLLGGLVLLRQEWGAQLRGGLPSMGGILQDLPRLSCQDLGKMMQAYPAVALKAGSLVKTCQSSSHSFGTGLNKIVTRVDSLLAPLAAKIEQLAASVHAPLAASSQAAQPPSSFRDLLTPQAFASALAPCSKDTLDDVYDAASRSTKQKLPTVAVACTNKKECAAALSAISAAAHSRHTKHIDGSFFDGPGLAGHLQNHVASFFKSSPHGVLIVERLERMSLDCLVVMRNTISENGNLQQDGHSVSTSGGLGIFISQLPGATPACSADLDSKFKNKLQRAAAVAEGVEANKSTLGKSLRRRIDFVVSAAEVPESA